MFKLQTTYLFTTLHIDKDPTVPTSLPQQLWLGFPDICCTAVSVGNSRCLNGRHPTKRRRMWDWKAISMAAKKLQWSQRQLPSSKDGFSMGQSCFPTEKRHVWRKDVSEKKHVNVEFGWFKIYWQVWPNWPPKTRSAPNSSCVEDPLFSLRSTFSTFWMQVFGFQRLAASG